MLRMTLILRRKLMVIAVQGVKIRLVSRRGIDQMAFKRKAHDLFDRCFGNRVRLAVTAALAGHPL